MKRRQLIKQFSVAGGATILVPSIFTSCASDDYQLSFFSKDEYVFVDELSEFILPLSEKSPGARQAKVANFMDKYISVCYSENQKIKFQKGILAFENQCDDLFNKSFIKLQSIDKGKALNNPEINSTDFFTHLHRLILFGFFTSQEGMTQALKYLAIPTKYEGHINYKKGDLSWAL